MINTADYTEFRKEVEEKEPHYYNTAMRAIQVADRNTMFVEGKKFPLSDNGFDSLRDLVKIPKRFNNRMGKILGDDAQLGLMDALRSGIAKANNDMQVTLAIGKEEGKINFIRERFPRISTAGFFDLVERVIDRYDLEPTTYSYDEHTGDLKFGTQATNRQYDLKNYEDEVFKAGPMFVSNFGDVQIHSFLQRLICENGLVGMRADQDFAAKLTREDMTAFFEYIDEMAERHFVPEEFVSRVERAMGTPASIREMEIVRNKLKDYSGPDQNEYLEYFVPLNQVYGEYANVGESPVDMSQRQKRNAPTNLSLWQLINNYTNFASHDQSDRGFSFNSSQANKMISDAGKLLSRNTYDTENLVRVPNFQMN